MTRNARLVAVVGLALAGCGSTAAQVTAHAASTAKPTRCDVTVADTLRDIAQRTYTQAAAGRDATGAAARVERSPQLAAAVAAQDPAAVRAALAPLLRAAIKRIVITDGGHVLADVGDQTAIAPISGTLARGGTFTLADSTATGFAKLLHALTNDGVVVRAGDRVLANDPSTRPTAVTTTLPGTAFPAGPLTIELRTPAANRALCGPDAATNTIAAVARRVYRGEQSGGATQAVLRTVAHNPTFARAVATDDPAALRAQIVRFFQDPALHVVRIRAVTRGGRLVNDVGGPYVLAPASAPVELHGRTVGKVTLSIQDDTGYMKLVRRFTGAGIVLRSGNTVVPGSTTTHGAAHVVRYTVGRFPTGRLHVTLLVP
ncbi:MAG TPA: hypothetical protein VNS09_27815 [Solirubrobacter sp.]|nr:hypothetical protein [Solirubrobacter sp.]